VLILPKHELGYILCDFSYLVSNKTFYAFNPRTVQTIHQAKNATCGKWNKTQTYIDQASKVVGLSLGARTIILVAVLPNVKDLFL
jgi:hypothetical protein